MRWSRFPGCCAATLFFAAVIALPSTAQDAQSADERLIIGPVNPHAFQRQEPDDEGADVEAEDVNLAAVLTDLGEDARIWYQHVMTLSNPFFEGRRPGLEGNRDAADYLQFWFEKYDLEPAFPEENAEEPGGGAAEWTSYRQPFAVGRGEQVWTDNVGGILPGRGDLADEWLIIGGHYDHTGYSRRGALRPGADDNASGTAGVLMMVKRLSNFYADAPEDVPLRSVLFMAFSAEEMGLIGSRYYTQHPTLDGDQVNAMINMDMIGRLRDDRLLVGGVGSAEGFLDILKPHFANTAFTIYADPSGRGPSDHASFYGAEIPVLFFFTGTHDVYHQPGDHGYTVNPGGAVRILDLVTDIALSLVTRAEKLSFTTAPSAPAGGGRGGSRVTLGIMLDYRAQLETGVKVGRAFDDSPAAKAGLREDDIILKWNDEVIEDHRTLRRLLSDAEAGETVLLTILRGETEQVVEVTPEER